MKRFWKVYSISLTILILLFAIGLGAYAAYQATLSYEIEIVPGLTELRFYSDYGATQEISSFKYAGVPRGSQLTRTIYVKNTGVETLNNLIASLSPSTVSWGTIGLTGANIGTLTTAQVKSFVWSASIPASAVSGNYTGMQIMVNSP